MVESKAQTRGAIVLVRVHIVTRPHRLSCPEAGSIISPSAPETIVLNEGCRNRVAIQPCLLSSQAGHFGTVLQPVGWKTRLDSSSGFPHPQSADVGATDKIEESTGTEGQKDRR